VLCSIEAISITYPGHLSRSLWSGRKGGALPPHSDR